MANQIKLLVHTEEGVIAEVMLSEGANEIIQAQENVSYEFQVVEGQVAPDEILVKRNGDHLEIFAEDSEAPLATIEGYFLLESPVPLVGATEGGEYLPFVPQSGVAKEMPWNLEEGESSYQSLGYDESQSPVPWWPILLAGVLLLGGGAALASKSSSSSSSDSDAGADGGDSGAGGSKDPELEPPTNVEFTEDGDKITGEGKPGAEIIVTDKDGNEIGRGEVDEDGKFEVELDEPLTNGETVDVVQKEDDTTSESTEVTAPELETPVDPDPELDPPVVNEVTSEDTEISGTAEPGSKVEVFVDGETIGTVEADEDGNWTLELPEDVILEGGEEVTATATDEAENTSEESDPVIVLSPPDAPEISEFDPNGEMSGKAEPGSKVHVYIETSYSDPTGAGGGKEHLGTVTADENGYWKLTKDDIDEALGYFGPIPFPEGAEVYATAENKAGTSEKSDPVIVSYESSPSVDPEEPDPMDPVDPGESDSEVQPHPGSHGEWSVTSEGEEINIVVVSYDYLDESADQFEHTLEEVQFDVELEAPATQINLSALLEEEEVLEDTHENLYQPQERENDVLSAEEGNAREGYKAPTVLDVNNLESEMDLDELLSNNQILY